MIDLEWNYSKSLEHIDVLIDGPYVDVLNNNLGIMGSSNQQIRILNKLFADRYQDAREWQRSSQVVENDSNLISVGIPLKTPGDDTHEI
ncbi:MAG: radical SAM protein [Synergistaceae bacterium]|nr:radical SAM protein [Synergistaceae bacterium]